MADILKAAEVAIAWGKARKACHTLFTLGDKTEGEARFRDRMKMLQGYIKGCMAKENLEVIPATTHLGNLVASDGMLAVQILAAGYDLTVGIDYTIEGNGENKDSPTTA